MTEDDKEITVDDFGMDDAALSKYMNSSIAAFGAPDPEPAIPPKKKKKKGKLSKIGQRKDLA